MATLEVHDGQGRVQFVELERDHPILFGTGPHCEVILEGPAIKPVHGRIRWTRGRIKVEASPDAEYVVINGHKMASGSIDLGDEVSVGSCRLFLLRYEAQEREPAPEPARPARRGAEDQGRTMVVPPPIPGAAGLGAAGRPAGAPPTADRRSRYVRPGDMGPELGDWARETGAGSPSAVVAEPQAEPDQSRGLKARFARALRKWLPEDAAPGEETIVSSPLVVSLILLLLVLVGMGFWLRAIIAATIAERTFSRAMDRYGDGDYLTAIRDFDTFIDANPGDERIPRARVMRALANVRQYVSPNGSTWTSALEAASAMFDEFGEGRIAPPEAFGDERAELGDLVLRIGEGLADRARTTADPKALAEAESAVPLHARVVGEPAPSLLTTSRLPAKLAQARSAVRKAQARADALAAMDRALDEGSASRVYHARDDLVGRYADLAQDRELIARMMSANELLRKAVKVVSTRQPAARGLRPEPLGPPTTLVLRSRAEPAAAPPAPESIVYALADGFGYGIDAAAGAPLWQLPLGLASPFAPRPVPGEPAAIAFDARANELLRLDARTGAVAWRLALGERVADPPLVLGNQLVQVLPSGKLTMIALETGELRATVDLGRPLSRSPVSDESGRHLYVLGRQDSLFILNRDPLGCAAVEYLGQRDGAVPCAPALLGRYLVVPENDSLADSRWHVLLLGEDGLKPRPVQDVPVVGWTWQTPTGSGPFLWATGDRGAFEAFAIGDYTRKPPFSSVAKLAPDAHATGPAFALARSERELWAAAGHSGKLVLDPEHGSIQATPLGVPGPARAPIQLAGTTIVPTFQDRELGGTALLGIEPESGVVTWKTVVGSAWPTELEPATGPSASASAGKGADGGLSTLGRDGREVVIASEQAARGGFIERPVPRPGAFALPAGLRVRLAHDGQSRSLVVPRPYSKSLWIQDSSRSAGWREVALPAAPAADPVAWHAGILIPGADGRVYLVDPATGRSLAEPFVPQFDRDNQGTWLAPALLDPDTLILADDAGRVRRLVLKSAPVPRLAVEIERLLESRIVTAPAAIGAAVLVATADGQVRSLAARDLSAIGAWPLEASIAGPPAGFPDGGFAMDRAGNVLAFGRDGQKAWAIKLGAEVVGAPRVVGQSLVILTSDGVLHVRARGDGAPIDRRALGVLPAGGPIAAGPATMIPVAPGTVRPLALGL